MNKPWYNVERVRQPGSVVLQAWREQHGPERLGRTPAARTGRAHNHRSHDAAGGGLRHVAGRNHC